MQAMILEGYLIDQESLHSVSSVRNRKLGVPGTVGEKSEERLLRRYRESRYRMNMKNID